MTDPEIYADLAKNLEQIAEIAERQRAYGYARSCSHLARLAQELSEKDSRPEAHVH
jgi:hypothetical protein